VVVGGFYYKAHPQLLQRQLGSFGAELLGIGAGVYLAFEAIPARHSIRPSSGEHSAQRVLRTNGLSQA